MAGAISRRARRKSGTMLEFCECSLPDVVAGYVNAPGSVFFNDGTGINFREVPWGDGKGSVYGIAIGDLDGDG
jgi:hypothetical protein